LWAVSLVEHNGAKVARVKRNLCRAGRHRRGDARGPWVPTFLPEGCWVKPSSLVHVRTVGYPRTTPGSSVVVPFLLEGVAWYMTFQSATSAVGILRRAHRLRTPSFSSIRAFRLSFFLFSFFYVFHDRADAPELYYVVAILI
jgi:hypothetical protein